jgi:hypothetical protein
MIFWGKIKKLGTTVKRVVHKVAHKVANVGKKKGKSPYLNHYPRPLPSDSTQQSGSIIERDSIHAPSVEQGDEAPPKAHNKTAEEYDSEEMDLQQALDESAIN